MAKFDELNGLNAQAVCEPVWKPGIRTGNDVVATWNQVEKVRYFVVGMTMVTNAAEIRLEAAKAQANSDGLLLGLALTAYRREQHHFPASLSGLSPRYLPTLPVDPLTGKALHYRIGSDGPVVYAVGENRPDRGGRPTPRPGDAMNWGSPTRIRRSIRLSVMGIG